ncbi:MAG: ADP-forming succinate--CoA ligase subunit beta [Dactylosporangium sp.]|nr:ADP-forming succinate--CoA ligase subunit beta [Dactylosporangium sp.]NNJ60408.1 ADP-forming succinate--CoA ligase subunit beta [Dactylosporangium sp.]
MDLFEYQGRALLARHGLPVLDGDVATTPEGAREIATRLGAGVVVKAQVKTGGRGKAGGVRLAENPDAAASTAADILGMDINGHTVRTVMVAAAADVVEEYYLSYLLDRTSRAFVCVASATGGVDIEQVARETPSRVVSVPLSADRGMDVESARDMVAAAGFPNHVADQIVDIAIGLWRAFVAEDATLIEVNPLALATDGMVRCLDAKVTIDDNASFRHPEHAGLIDRTVVDPLERLARERGLPYVRLDGQVGVIGNGAGLVMSTLDVVAQAGETLGVGPANFLDIGGGASAAVMADALETVLADPAVRSVLVNVFGGITACDAVAEGILRALDLIAERGQPLGRTLVVRLDGNGAEEARRILLAAAHPCIERVSTMERAARRAAEIASTAGV